MKKNMKSRRSRTKSGAAKRRGAPLGQHFLKNPAVAEAVAEAADVRSGDTVIEVGPGRGILTRALLERGARVIAIEKDPALVKVLKETFANEIRDSKFEIHEGDIRDVAILESIFLNLESDNYKVAANIPYYITGELIRLFLTAEKQPETLAFLVQKEVAERIARSKKESILSLSVKAYGVPRYVKTVSRGNFTPPPKVDSAILSVSDISRNNFNPDSLIIYDKAVPHAGVREKDFFALLHAGFGQKRKKLAGNLKRVFGARALQALDEAEIGRDARAEDVPLSAWLLLTKELSERPS